MTRETARPYRQLRINGWSRAGERRGVSPPVLPSAENMTTLPEQARVALSG
jgi:hypothetical protein